MMPHLVDVDGGESSLRQLRRDDAWRHARVAVAAYYFAQGRGFAAGGEAADWRSAEAQTAAVDQSGE